MCTGLRLIAANGDVVYGRTMEWNTFDIGSRLALVPKNYEFRGTTPEGRNGLNWIAKHGFFGFDVFRKDFLADGMNEKGLAAGGFYHPGFAEYFDFNKEDANISISPLDVVNYILSNYASVEEVKRGIFNIRIVSVPEEKLGNIVPPAHWFITDKAGNSIVIEHHDKKLKYFDNPLGVFANSPSFDWHMTNLRNYLNLSPMSSPIKKLKNIDLAPLSTGSGMVGLPGDFTSPSRFVRVTAWASSARIAKNGDEEIFEILRILDNFNVPLSADVDPSQVKGLKSGTSWTSGWDLSNGLLYYHTQHNRRVRKLDFRKLDFLNTEQGIINYPLDRVKKQDIQEL